MKNLGGMGLEKVGGKISRTIDWIWYGGSKIQDRDICIQTHIEGTRDMW